MHRAVRRGHARNMPWAVVGDATTEGTVVTRSLDSVSPRDASPLARPMTAPSNAYASQQAERTSGV